MIGNLYLGYVLGKKIDSAEDFFLGRRTTPWWAIGISVIATHVSALSFLGAPAWSYATSLVLEFITGIDVVHAIVIVTVIESH